MTEPAIKKTRWMQLADELFPGESVESPSVLYSKFARTIVQGSVRIDLDTRLTLSANDEFAAEEAVWGTLAYSLAYNSQMTDGQQGNHNQLEVLADQYIRTMYEERDR